MTDVEGSAEMGKDRSGEIIQQIEMAGARQEGRQGKQSPQTVHFEDDKLREENVFEKQ